MTPAGDLIATPARGAWMGNRGCLHDGDRHIVRRWTTRRWIICRTTFRGRRRAVMTPHRYTELFFLDEATALAAGHRPCAQCRRADFRRFAEAWARGNGTAAPTAGEIDAVLHAQRRLSRRPLDKNDDWTSPAVLPDGTIVERAANRHYWLIANLRFWRWSPSGYSSGEDAGSEAVRPVTPRATRFALAGGYAAHCGITLPQRENID